MTDRVLYKNGVWVWDQYNDGVMFTGKDAIQQVASNCSRSSNISRSISGRKNIDIEIQVMDTLDGYAKAKFRKHYQRKVKVGDVAVATIQDVKDVAIFTSKVSDLSLEFISYFHTAVMDRFLRSMIVYFQYYLQIWNRMQRRRAETSRQLRHPRVIVLEDEIRDNLADLRSMVSRDYAAILLGLEDVKMFHHMSNKNNDSLSDKDRKLFEILCFMTVKVVWIALFRKNLPLLERETNRLLRTLCFSPVESSGVPLPQATSEEERLLTGKAFKNEKRLLHRSPIIQEIIFDNHDYRMLAIGLKNIKGADERIRYLEIAYAAPEELLVESGIAVGVLGVDRKYLDTILKPKEISTTVKISSLMKIGEFNLPPRKIDPKWKYSDTLPEEPCFYRETQATRANRRAQCKKWRSYVDAEGIFFDDSSDVSSILNLRTSIVAKEKVSNTQNANIN
ncbi:uncharacterized protein LOC115880109 [Sitophilus oryzae]|uniref:Uncharacterized protein LOC115880109 n=1 Tax=Sitophilus oryzae TaxID=7048 RepID=A0A6J2XQH1_SITOR|nr:uncharacterized protein LOC115880109 [Sitophilus oryzae]